MDAILDQDQDGISSGTVVAGKYRLDRRLGSGAMGTVWAGTHLVLGERVALKFVSANVALSEDVRARFVREARAAARLNSRFTVRVFDTGDFANRIPYIVMEYLEGETLNQRLLREGRMPLADAARILVQIARGLSRAHGAGIIHRDIKPENIFLAYSPDDGVIAKIFDFGVAKLAESVGSACHDATQTGVLIGTPQFMSPEQALGDRDVDHRTDIYSLGVLAHRMLTGKRLFSAESFAGLLLQVCGDAPLPSLREGWPEAPPSVDEWFQRTCARDKTHRYASAMQCVEALVVAAGLTESMMAEVSTSLVSARDFVDGLELEVADASKTLHLPGAPLAGLEPSQGISNEAPRPISAAGGKRNAASVAVLAVSAAVAVGIVAAVTTILVAKTPGGAHAQAPQAVHQQATPSPAALLPSSAPETTVTTRSGGARPTPSETQQAIAIVAPSAPVDKARLGGAGSVARPPRPVVAAPIPSAKPTSPTTAPHGPPAIYDVGY